ncbi:hypothetical protein [Hymenobacter negativus]|uniref:Minor tail protein n=1 Tax=Hymenobacter negativus TaxID=2795026 RepID=A0ABS3QI00_9BACT|nr:hypothetical protein [Hymenobacter negativus]MBO2010875.1 hypothetical protein [Hymenobacter negativus]
MSTTTNEVWVRGERLDLDDETALLPSFQANDRSKPDTIQSSYSPEFSVPGNTHNHRLLRQAAASQSTQGAAYVRVPAVLTSGGVETLPLAILTIKGYSAGRYQLQLFGGNRRLVEQLGEKTLRDLDLSRFNHLWTPANIAPRLPYAYWETNGYGYEIYDRGKNLDFQSIDPWQCYPSVAAWLIWNQILTDAGFTADSLMGEPLFAALNVPVANPFVYSNEFREARALNAGLVTTPTTNPRGIEHESEFGPERLPMVYTAQAPYHAPSAGATYTGARYTVDTLGYYNLSASVFVHFYCDTLWPGKVSCKVELRINGQPIYQNGAQIAYDESSHVAGPQDKAFAPRLDRWILHPGDTVELFWQGDEWDGFGNVGPTDPLWQVGYRGRQYVFPNGDSLDTQVTFTVTLLEEFPPGGLIKLNEWLPDGVTQLEFVKTIMILLSLTITCDNYRPHLHLATGNKLLENIPIARNWSNKLDLFAPPSRLPERDLVYKFGDYGKRNLLQWKEDENVKKGYGNGEILVADENLPAEYVLATLPFAASEPSDTVPGVLRILNYKASDITVQPVAYSGVKAQPRLVLREEAPISTGQIDMGNGSLQPFTTSLSYFASVGLSLLLDTTVLSVYWADLKAMLDETRYLVEQLRLTPADIAGLDYSIPVWIDAFQDYFAVSRVEEYSPSRSTSVHLVRLSAKHLPPPVLPGDGREFWRGEFYQGEWY